MTKEWEEYISDPRTVCKYGLKCYQKNPEHHAKYKHPPSPHNLTNKRGNRDKQRYSPYRRHAPSPIANADAKTSRDSGPTENKNVIDNELLTTTVTDTDKRTKDIEPATISHSESVSTSNDSEPCNSTNTESHKNHINIHEKQGASLANVIEKLVYYDSTQHEILQELFLMEMPEDFFRLYECLSKDNDIEKALSSVNLELIGPYDLLLGKLPIVENKELYLVHWRFFYDPPEFQAVVKKKGKSEFHIGYFRDVPSEKPVFLASNDSSKDYHIKPIAQNIFGALYLYLQNEKKSSPFTSVACQKLMEKVKKFADENKYSLEEYNMKRRQAKIVTKSFHGAGIVVPYNKKTQLGYRHLVENDGTIKKMFTKLQAAKNQKEKDDVLSELQPVITYASIALDECDFGTGVEAGIALFCSGLMELEPSALSSMTSAYKLLNREVFSKIIQAHLKFRRKGPNMTLLTISDKC